MNTYKDKYGYKREHSDAIHRKRAYTEIYLKNRKKYPKPFSHYEVHHKDFDKTNNRVSNLQIVTPTEHDKIHEEREEKLKKEKEKIEEIEAFESEKRRKKEEKKDKIKDFFKSLLTFVLLGLFLGFGGFSILIDIQVGTFLTILGFLLIAAWLLISSHFFFSYSGKKTKIIAYTISLILAVMISFFIKKFFYLFY